MMIVCVIIVFLSILRSFMGIVIAMLELTDFLCVTSCSLQYLGHSGKLKGESWEVESLPLLTLAEVRKLLLARGESQYRDFKFRVDWM